MLTAINVELTAVADGNLPVGNALYIHDLFFKLLQEVDPVISVELHQQKGLRPFTLSMLRGLKAQNNLYQVKGGKKYSFRAAFIDERLFLAFYNAVYSYFTAAVHIRIRDIEFVITAVYLEKITGFKELNSEKPLQYKSFIINFLSPTTFGSKSIHYILPDVSVVFENCINKWNYFCPKLMKIPSDKLQLITESCYLVKYNLKTENVNIDNYKIVGFKGSCYFEIPSNVDEKVLRYITTLLKFTRYSGIGYKTTMGMGQVKVTFCV